jgi:hypothetical protein
MLEGARGIAEAERGHALRASEVSAYWATRARREVAADPARWVRLLAKKTFLFGFAREIPNNHDPVLFERRFPFLRWLPGWGVWAPLGIVGWIAARRRRGSAELGAVVFGVFVSCVAFFVNARYRVPALPFLIALAAGGWVSTTSVRGKLALLAGALGIGVFWHWNPYEIPTRVWVPSYVLLAEAERDRHESVRALRWVEQALDEAPGFYPARMLQIELLRGTGRAAEALEIARRGVEGLPQDAAFVTRLRLPTRFW